MKRLLHRLRMWVLRRLDAVPWSAVKKTIHTYQEAIRERDERIEEEIEERRQLAEAWEEKEGTLRSELYREQARRLRAEDRLREIEKQAEQRRQAVRVLRAEKILNPLGATSREVIELEHADLTEQIVKMVRDEVHFQTFSDFKGNCRIIATLAVVPADGEEL